jgi:hypothetical protein
MLLLLPEQTSVQVGRAQCRYVGVFTCICHTHYQFTHLTSNLFMKHNLQPYALPVWCQQRLPLLEPFQQEALVTHSCPAAAACSGKPRRVWTGYCDVAQQQGTQGMQHAGFTVGAAAVQVVLGRRCFCSLNQRLDEWLCRLPNTKSRELICRGSRQASRFRLLLLARAGTQQL